MIGAPLGSIIRKGGLGMPLVFAIIFFVFFYLLNNFGEKLVRSNELSPLNGMWLSTFLLIPIGLFLTYKAMSDSQLFNNEFYYRQYKRFRLFLATFSTRKNHP
jgi:lipopolysaccharide export system permease protein